MSSRPVDLRSSLAGGDFVSDRSLLADEATGRLPGTHVLASTSTLCRILGGCRAFVAVLSLGTLVGLLDSVPIVCLLAAG